MMHSVCHILKQHGTAIVKNVQANSVQKATLVKSCEYLQTLGK